MKSTPAFLLRVFEELEDFNGEFYQESYMKRDPASFRSFRIYGKMAAYIAKMAAHINFGQKGEEI